jgi:hypothetical protein
MLPVTGVVGYRSKYALPVHENIEMKLKGLSRDPRLRRIEQGGDPANARPRPRKREPKGQFWDPQGQGQAKFLEAPARSMRDQLATLVRVNVQNGVPLPQAIYLACLALLAASQPLVPVNTGNLRASGFAALE